MQKIIFTTLFMVFAGCSFLSAQNIKDETVEYAYIKLPHQPVDVSIKNYQSSVFATYEEENAKKRAAYEAEKTIAQAEYEKEMEAYPAQLKEAEEKYAAELEEWDEKSLGDKVIEKQVLGENNKPVQHIPAEPRLRYVQEPKLQTSYDYPVIANHYLQLGGFENKANNAIKIEATIYGYDYTQPRQMTIQKNETSYADGKTQTMAVTYYYTEFSYRHPMSVNVTAPDGSVILNITPQELNIYRIYKSAESEKPPQINSEMLVKTSEENVFQENLRILNDLVNDKIGYQPTTRKAELSFVKSKDETYKDLLIAFNDASAGLKLLTDDKAAAKTKLDNAIQLWNTALKESDMQNKKARIDKDITVAICFNLLEVYFASANVADAEKIISQLNTVNLPAGERRQKDDFEALFNDLKKRLEANK